MVQVELQELMPLMPHVKKPLADEEKLEISEEKIENRATVKDLMKKRLKKTVTFYP